MRARAGEKCKRAYSGVERAPSFSLRVFLKRARCAVHPPGRRSGRMLGSLASPPSPPPKRYRSTTMVRDGRRSSVRPLASDDLGIPIFRLARRD